MIDELVEMAPGPQLSAALATVDRSVLNGHDMVEVMRARARQLAHEQAQLLADMWEVAHCAPCLADDPPQRVSQVSEFAPDEIRFALHLTRNAANTQLSLAFQLLDRLPAVHTALANGHIDLRRAAVIADMTTCLDDEHATAVADRALERAGSQTTGQLRARLRRLILTADPRVAGRRTHRALRERRVELHAEDDGTATLTAYGLPADRAAAAMARLTATARSAKVHGAPSTMAGSVELIVPLTTLMRLADEPGDLGGYGPVVADLARQMAQRSRNAQWRYSIIDPHTGHLIHHGTTRRRPTAEDTAFVQARDRSCRAPGCRIPAAHADIDHTVDHANGGPSTVDNCGPLCRHDHRMKHEGGWKLQQTTPGVFQWTSPLGHTYTVTPPDLRNGPSG